MLPSSITNAKVNIFCYRAQELVVMKSLGIEKIPTQVLLRQNLNQNSLSKTIEGGCVDRYEILQIRACPTTTMEQQSVDSPPTPTMEAASSPLLARTSVSLPRTPGCPGTATLSSPESSQSCSSFPRRQFSAPLDAGATSSPSARSTLC